jgi:hypothetical protein
MWVEAKIAGVCVGEDKRLEFELYDLGSLSLVTYPKGFITDAQLDALITAGTVTKVDATAWAFEFALRPKDTSTGAPLVQKETGDGVAVEGTGADQLVVVTLEDDDTAAADGSSVTVPPGKYRYSLKRTDDGAETIYRRGDFQLAEATLR